MNASAQRTSYGALRWIEVTSQREPRGIASLLPIGTVGTHEVDVLRAAASAALALAITAGIVRYLRRELGNLSPRWRCQSCGHMVNGSAHSNVCPECGDLPNRKKDAWAVWR